MSIIHFLTDFRGWSEKLQLTACCLFLNLESLEETVTAVVYFVLKPLLEILPQTLYQVVVTHFYLIDQRLIHTKLGS